MIRAFSKSKFLRKYGKVSWDQILENTPDKTSKITELISKGEEPNFEIFRKLFIENLFNGQVLDGIYKDLKQKDLKIPGSLYQALISFSTKEDEIEKYIQEVNTIGITKNFEMLKCLIFHFMQKGQDDKFLELFDVLKNENFSLDLDLYILLARYYVKKGQGEKLEEILKEMKEKKIEGNEVFYQTLFSFYQTHDTSKLTKLIKTLKKKGVLKEQKSKDGSLPSFESVNEMLEVFETPKLHLSPKEIVEELDKYIIGQPDAKKVVAIAFKNRLRRRLLSDKLKKEILPKNILMVGPTGCGKTEICRRLSTIIDVPFVKVEATQYTEVGYHGKDVDSIIQDLVNNGIEKMKKRIQNDSRIESLALELISRVLFKETKSPELWKQMLKSGEFDNQYISYKYIKSDSFDLYPKKKIKISEGIKILKNELIERIIEREEFKPKVISFIEQESIVFIDEIDKICSQEKGRNNPSSEGVQRDLLPLIEGTNVQTEYGKINTENILFICSGAFHNVKPQELMPELQGRLPIRVELQHLKQEDFHSILTKTNMNVLKQNIELLKVDNIELEFTDEAIEEIAKMTFEMNSYTENLGARRLNTVIEKIIDEYSFNNEAGKYVITGEIIKNKLEAFMKKSDLSKFII